MKQVPGLILAVVCAVFLVGAVGLPTQAFLHVVTNSFKVSL